MKKTQLIESKELRLKLLTAQRKGMQLHRVQFKITQRYIIEVITDKSMQQVRKTFKQFQQFNKILQHKFLLKDKQLQLNNKLFGHNDKYGHLQQYIARLNSCYLNKYSRQNHDQNNNFDYFSNKTNTSNATYLQPQKIKELRGYLFTLLFGGRSNEEDDESDRQIKEQHHKKKLQPNKQIKSENTFFPKPIIKAMSSSDMKAINSATTAMNSKQQISGSTDSKAKQILKTFKNFKDKITKVVHPQPIPQFAGMMNVLKTITKCWIQLTITNKQSNKNIPKYIWQQFDIKFNDNLIQLTKNKFDNQYHRIYILYKCQVQILTNQYTKLIIKNNIDKYPLQIRLSLIKQSLDITQKYLAIYTYVKLTQQKFNKIYQMEKQSEIVNKVKINIHIKKQQKHSQAQLRKMSTKCIATFQSDDQKPNPSHRQHLSGQKKKIQQKNNCKNNLLKFITIKVIHHFIQAFVTLSIGSSVDIDFPIVDNFGNVEIRVYQETKETGGYFPLVSSKDPLYTYNVPVQTIYHCMYNEKMPQLVCQEHKQKTIEIRHTKLNLNFDYKCISSSAAWCSYYKDDIYQQDEPPKQFHRDEFRMNRNRLKRIAWSIQLFAEAFKDVINFTYPNLSYLIYIFLALCCLFYDNNNFFIWVLISLIIILLYNCPLSSIYLKDLIKCIQKASIIRKKVRRFLYKKNPRIQQQYITSKKREQKRQYLQKFELTRKIKRSIYKKYKIFLQILLKMQIVLIYLVSIIQKIKNLFIWYHFQKTLFFFCILLFLLITIAILPIRIILCAIIVKNMIHKSKYYQQIHCHNKKIVKKLIQKIVKDNNFTSIQPYLKQQTKKFNTQIDQFRTFYKLCDNLLSQWLQVKIKIDQIQIKSSTMQQLFINLSQCKQPYHIKKEINDKYRLNIQQYKKQSSILKYFSFIYGFIITIPSDKYIMGVKTINITNKQQQQQQQQQQSN